MKKIKKVLALLVAMVMVMGMTVTVSAAAATITVENLDKDAKIESVQVIAPNPTKPSGWEFINGAGTVYASAFGLEETEENLQNIIWSLILYKDSNATVPKGIVAAQATQIQTALKNVTGYSNTSVKDNVINVNSAGVYAIKATTTNEEVYVYSPMAAYVAFSNYDTSTGIPSGLESVKVNAKKTTLEITKESDEKDDVVAVGDDVEYTVKTTVPYIKDDITKVEYKLTDIITGATYKTKEVNGKTLLDNVSVTLGGKIYSKDLKFIVDPTGTSFTVDLSEIAAERENANKELIITYQATVTGIVVNNAVEMTDGNHEWGDDDILYTGRITLTKTGENDEKLANAGFKVYRNTDKKFAVVAVNQDTISGSNEYLVESWTNKEDKASVIFTGEDGTLTIKGLNDNDTYSFKEVQAPNGYSINETDAVAKWDANSPATDKIGTASMKDTKLSSLPSTGGIGTTIFTIGGCVIMIVAAGLFFASRRKENK